MVIAPPDAGIIITYWPFVTPPLNVKALIVPVNPVTVAVANVAVVGNTALNVGDENVAVN